MASSEGPAKQTAPARRSSVGQPRPARTSSFAVTLPCKSSSGLAYGYRNVNRFDGRGELIRGLREVDEEQGKVVRRIFEEFAAGQSPRAIAEGLNKDGVESPDGRLSGPRFWRASTIYGDRKRKNGILQNRLYIGSSFLIAPARCSIRVHAPISFALIRRVNGWSKRCPSCGSSMTKCGKACSAY